MVTKLKRNNLCLRSFFEIEMPLYIGYHRIKKGKFHGSSSQLEEIRELIINFVKAYLGKNSYRHKELPRNTK